MPGLRAGNTGVNKASCGVHGGFFSSPCDSDSERLLWRLSALVLLPFRSTPLTHKQQTRNPRCQAADERDYKVEALWPVGQRGGVEWGCSVAFSTRLCALLRLCLS